MNVIKAIQTIYPNIQGGFSYWQTKLDGSEWDFPIDGLVWENKQFEKPTWQQIESSNQKLEDAAKETTEQKKLRIKSELITPRKSYLSKTDWYVIREFDLAGTYPKEIKFKRIQAWQEIAKIEAATTLTTLNQFNSTFE